MGFLVRFGLEVKAKSNNCCSKMLSLVNFLRRRLHSDLNGALNVLKRTTNLVVSTTKELVSFLLDHDRIAPIKGCNP
jgi:hypothetical protein